MGSAAARRSLAAVVAVLASSWCGADSDVHAPERSVRLFVAMTAAVTAPVLALRRQAGALSSSCGETARGPATAGAATLLALLLLVRWAMVAAVAAASPLSRRRHVIALRGPPRLHP